MNSKNNNTPDSHRLLLGARQVPILLYSSKNIKNSYNFYSYVLKCRRYLSVS